MVMMIFGVRGVLMSTRLARDLNSARLARQFKLLRLLLVLLFCCLRGRWLQLVRGKGSNVCGRMRGGLTTAVVVAVASRDTHLQSTTTVAVQDTDMTRDRAQTKPVGEGETVSQKTLCHGGSPKVISERQSTNAAGTSDPCYFNNGADGKQDTQMANRTGEKIDRCLKPGRDTAENPTNAGQSTHRQTWGCFKALSSPNSRTPAPSPVVQNENDSAATGPLDPAVKKLPTLHNWIGLQPAICAIETFVCDSLASRTYSVYVKYIYTTQRMYESASHYKGAHCMLDSKAEGGTLDGLFSA